MTTNEQRLLDILLDVWYQFSIESVKNGKPTRWDACMSVLGDVEYELHSAGMIDEYGQATEEISTTAAS